MDLKDERYLLDLPIEVGVPIPKSKSGLRGATSHKKKGYLHQLIFKLDAGHSVLIPINRNRVAGKVSQMRYLYPDRDFTTRSVEAGKSVRVWRIK